MKGIQFRPKTKKNNRGSSTLKRVGVIVGVFLLVFVLVSACSIGAGAEMPDSVVDVLPVSPTTFNGGQSPSNSSNVTYYVPGSNYLNSTTRSYFTQVLSGQKRDSNGNGFNYDVAPGSGTAVINPLQLQRLYYFNLPSPNSLYSISEASLLQVIGYVPQGSAFRVLSDGVSIPCGRGVLAVSRLTENGNIRGIYYGNLTLRALYDSSEVLNRDRIVIQIQFDYASVSSFQRWQLEFTRPYQSSANFTYSAGYVRFGNDEYDMNLYSRTYFMFGSNTSEDITVSSPNVESFLPLFYQAGSDFTAYTYPYLTYQSFMDGVSLSQVSETEAYNRGYQDGFANPATNSIINVVKTVMEAPFYIIAHGFNVDFMGINFANVIFFILSVAVAWFVIRILIHMIS